MVECVKLVDLACAALEQHARQNPYSMVYCQDTATSMANVANNFTAHVKLFK